jgi:hypothetical protein
MKGKEYSTTRVDDHFDVRCEGVTTPGRAKRESDNDGESTKQQQQQQADGARE